MTGAAASAAASASGPAFGAIASPAYAAGYSANPVAPATTSMVTASGSGGIVTNYLWRQIDSTPGWGISSPTSASTTFTVTFYGGLTSINGLFECQLTDSLGRIAITNPVSATGSTTAGTPL